MNGRLRFPVTTLEISNPNFYAKIKTNSPSLRTCQTGFQLTPAVSMAMPVQPLAASQSDTAMRSLVAVLNVLTSRLTASPTM